MSNSSIDISLTQMHGIVVLDKPSGPSSAQCLGAFKRQGQRKIGHAGTLDPMASGVLPVLLGNATKLAGWLLRGGRKIYSGQIRLGIETDTWDMTGRVVAEAVPDGVFAEDVERAVKEWAGITEQEVPAYSAAKYNGQPLYKLARKGHDTPVKTKQIVVYEACMLNFSMPFVDFRVACGSGSYIRSLAHSLGKRLGCGAALAVLRREYSHPFDISVAWQLEEIRNGLAPAHVLPLTAALPDWPRISLTPAQVALVCNGRPVRAAQGSVGDYAFLCGPDRVPLAIGRWETGRNGAPCWGIERGLWTGDPKNISL